MDRINRFTAVHNTQIASQTTKDLSQTILFKHPKTFRAVNMASKIGLVVFISMVFVTLLCIVSHQNHILQYLKSNITNLHHLLCIMFVLTSTSIAVNFIMVMTTLYLWSQQIPIKDTSLIEESNIPTTEKVFAKGIFHVDNSKVLYKNAVDIVVQRQTHVLALQSRDGQVSEKKLIIERIFNDVTHLLTIDVNTDQVLHLAIYKDIKKLVGDYDVQGEFTDIMVRIHLWLFQQRFINLYHQPRIISCRYVQKCIKDTHLLMSMVVPVFSNINTHISSKLDNITKNLLGILVKFSQLLANEDIVVITDEALVQQYNLSITHISAHRPNYLTDINLTLPSIGFKCKVLRTQYPPLYQKHNTCTNNIPVLTAPTADDPLTVPSNYGFIVDMMRIWQYATAEEKTTLLKKYTICNDSDDSSMQFTFRTMYNDTIWKFALTKDGSNPMSAMIFRFVKVMVTEVEYTNYRIPIVDECIEYIDQYLQSNNIHLPHDVIKHTIQVFCFCYRNKFLELLCSDNPKPLKTREIFSFDDVSLNKPYSGYSRSLGLDPVTLYRIDDDFLPLLVTQDSAMRQNTNMCFFNFDKIFCGLIVAFDKLLRTEYVHVIQNVEMSNVVDTTMTEIPHSIKNIYVPSIERIRYDSKMYPVTKVLAATRVDDTCFPNITEEDRVTFEYEGTLQQFIYIGRNNNTKIIFNEVKTMLSLFDEDYSNNIDELKSLMIYKICSELYEMECLQVVKIYISCIRRFTLDLCDKEVCYDTLCNTMISELQTYGYEYEPCRFIMHLLNNAFRHCIVLKNVDNPNDGEVVVHKESVVKFNKK